MTLPSEGDRKLWLALLYEIEQHGGAVAPVFLYPRMRTYFPQITDSDAEERFVKSDENIWKIRIQFARQKLVDRGLLDNATFGVWRITPAGRGWLVVHWRGADADYSHIEAPPVTRQRPDTRPRSRISAPTAVPVARSQPAGPMMHQLIRQGLAEGAGIRDPLDLYLLALVSYELGRYREAHRLAGNALALGLAGEFSVKAQHLRELSSLKSER